MLVDDALDGDETIAHALWTPIEGVEWDLLTFQVYRSLFQAFAPALSEDAGEFTPGLITSYADDIQATWGARGGLDLGTTAEGMISEGGLEGPEALQADIAAGLAAGVPAGRIHLYSLEGAADRPDGADWVALPQAAAAEPDPATLEVRALIATLDGLGD